MNKDKNKTDCIIKIQINVIFAVNLCSIKSTVYYILNTILFHDC